MAAAEGDREGRPYKMNHQISILRRGQHTELVELYGTVNKKVPSRLGEGT